MRLRTSAPEKWNETTNVWNIFTHLSAPPLFISGGVVKVEIYEVDTKIAL